MKRIISKRKFYRQFGQSIIEYFIIMCVILVAVLSTGLIGRMRDSFSIYFNGASAGIVNAPAR